MKRYDVCARGYAWLAERESADGLWVKYDEAAAECDELRQQLAAAQERNTAEKKRREYYQYIVYSVCNMLDQIDGRHHCIVCGTAEEPCNNVEAKIQQLTTELDSLRQQLAAAQERNVFLQSEHLDHVAELRKRIKELEKK
jgi:DNA repair exonuclease SbcCD ATPase subunit